MVLNNNNKNDLAMEMLLSGRPLPQSVLNQIVGSKLLCLDYTSGKKPNGKNSWRWWLDYFPEGTDYETIKSKFKKAVSDGYVKGYVADEPGKDGMFIRQMTVKSVEQLHQSSNKWGSYDDLGLTLELDFDDDNIDWTRTVYIGGKFKLDEQGNRKISSVMKIKMFLDACKVKMSKTEDESPSTPPETSKVVLDEEFAL